MAVLRACRGHGGRLRCALASLLCVFTLAIVSCGSPASQAPTPTPGKVLRGALTVDGVERSYRLFRPSLAARMKVPLVIVLHEYGTTGEDMSALSLYDQHYQEPIRHCVPRRHSRVMERRRLLHAGDHKGYR